MSHAIFQATPGTASVNSPSPYTSISVNELLDLRRDAERWRRHEQLRRARDERRRQRKKSMWVDLPIQENGS